MKTSHFVALLAFCVVGLVCLVLALVKQGPR
jgi:hypothetical protein